MNLWRRWLGSTRGGVPRRRPSLASQKRRAACKRMSKLASRHSSTANGEPLAGIVGSQTRWVAPPSGTIACHPSGARRNSAPGTPGRSRSNCPISLGKVTSRRAKTVDKASGAQKIGCLSKASCGSAAKSQPPLSAKSFSRNAQSLRTIEALVVILVFGIAPEPLPSDVH